MANLKVLIVLVVLAALMSDVSSKKQKRKKASEEKQCECGRHSPVSKFFAHAQTDYYPWVVNLMDKRNNMTTFCMGTLVTENLVLTPVSCVINPNESEKVNCKKGNSSLEACYRTPIDIAVGFGSPTKTKSAHIFSKSEASAVERIILQYHYHHYHESHLDEELALLKLAKVYECEERVPVCLGTNKMTRSWKSGIMTGWTTERITIDEGNVTNKTSSLNVVHNRKCMKVQGHRTDKQAVSCSLKNKTASVCQGDAGAPVFILRHKRIYIVGVMSKAVADDECEKHEMLPLISIQKHTHWIHRIIQKEADALSEKSLSRKGELSPGRNFSQALTKLGA